MVLTLEETTLLAKEMTWYYSNAEQCRRQTEVNLLRLNAFVEAFRGQTTAVVCRFQECGLSYLELGEDRFMDGSDEVTYGDEAVIAELGNHCAHLYIGRINFEGMEVSCSKTRKLIEEGKIRDAIRMIQDLRKDKGLKPSDKMEYEVPDSLKGIFGRNAGEIKKATNIEF